MWSNKRIQSDALTRAPDARRYAMKKMSVENGE